MRRPVKDLARSVHDRLLALAKQTGRPFTEVLLLYAMERFLYRLSQSKESRKFVLKGGLMLRVWKAPVTRPTRDLDLLGQTKNTIENLEPIVRGICDETVEPDGLHFDAKTVRGALIKEGAEYSGVRVTFTGFLEKARIPMQIDVGFGDAVVPMPLEIDVPTMLDFPAPKLRGYQRETTIAEKFHAMVMLGTLNTRMKDFYDIWLLAQCFDFDAKQLAAALRATFKARGTELEADPVALSPSFAGSTDAQKLWSAFLKKSALTDAPQDFPTVIAVIRSFILPVVQVEPPSRWTRGKGWA